MPTRVSKILDGSQLKMSCDSTTISANLPGVMEPGVCKSWGESDKTPEIW